MKKLTRQQIADLFSIKIDGEAVTTINVSEFTFHKDGEFTLIDANYIDRTYTAETGGNYLETVKNQFTAQGYRLIVREQTRYNWRFALADEAEEAAKEAEAAAVKAKAEAQRKAVREHQQLEADRQWNVFKGYIHSLAGMAPHHADTWGDIRAALGVLYNHWPYDVFLCWNGKVKKVIAIGEYDDETMTCTVWTEAESGFQGAFVRISQFARFTFEPNRHLVAMNRVNINRPMLRYRMYRDSATIEAGYYVNDNLANEASWREVGSADISKRFGAKQWSIRVQTYSRSFSDVQDIREYCAAIDFLGARASWWCMALNIKDADERPVRELSL